MTKLNYGCLDELIVQDMPLLKGPVMHILKILGDFDVPSSAIANAIGHDPSVATRVLKVANSPLFNVGREVTSLKTAVLTVGQENLYKMVIMMNVADVFNNNANSVAIEDRIWKHSLAVGYAARELMIMRRQSGCEEAFLGGILHDIGKLLLFRYDPSFYRVVIQEYSGEDHELNEKELEAYGFTHAQIGWMAAARWDLPINICESIASHHCIGNEAPDSPVAIAIEAADVLTSSIGFGVHTLKKSQEEIESVFIKLAAKLNLPLAKIKIVADSTESSMKWLMRLF